MNSMREGSLESVDFSTPARFDLEFSREHPEHPRARFSMSRSLGGLGEATASPESAKGNIDLRPGEWPRP